MKALIFENMVVDVAETEFDVHESMTWMDAPDNCKTGWHLEDGVITAPPADPALPYDVERRRAFPLLGDQLDDLFRNGSFSDEMTATLQAVKTKWPKDNSGPVE